MNPQKVRSSAPSDSAGAIDPIDNHHLKNLSAKMAEFTGQMNYIAEMLGELRVMADNNGEGMLAYLIEMAELQAKDINSKEHSPTKDRV